MHGKKMWCAIATSLFAMGIADASTLTQEVTLTTLASRADGAYVGTVTGLNSRAIDDHHLESVVTLQIEQTVFGPEADSKQLIIVHQGGELDGHIDRVFSAPSFHTGERTLVFLEHDDNDQWVVVNDAVGKLDILLDPTTGQDLVRASGHLLGPYVDTSAPARAGGIPGTVPLRRIMGHIPGAGRR